MNAPLRHADTVRQVDSNDPRDIARVEAFVEELDGSVFHRPLWLQAIARGTGNDALGLVLERFGPGALLVRAIPAPLCRSPMPTAPAAPTCPSHPEPPGS